MVVLTIIDLVAFVVVVFLSSSSFSLLSLFSVIVFAVAFFVLAFIVIVVIFLVFAVPSSLPLSLMLLFLSLSSLLSLLSLYLFALLPSWIILSYMLCFCSVFEWTGGRRNIEVFQRNPCSKHMFFLIVSEFLFLSFKYSRKLLEWFEILNLFQFSTPIIAPVGRRYPGSLISNCFSSSWINLQTICYSRFGENTKKYFRNIYQDFLFWNDFLRHWLKYPSLQDLFYDRFKRGPPEHAAPEPLVFFPQFYWKSPPSRGSIFNLSSVVGDLWDICSEKTWPNHLKEENKNKYRDKDNDKYIKRTPTNDDPREVVKLLTFLTIVDISDNWEKSKYYNHGDLTIKG